MIDNTETNNTDTLGKRIMALRKAAGMTQEQVAERLGISPQAVSKWENDVSCPDISILPQLAEKLGVTTDELLGVKPIEPKVVIVDGQNKKDGDGSFSVSWDGAKNAKKDGVWFAVLMIVLGIAFLLQRLNLVSFGIWGIIWPAVIIGLGHHRTGLLANHDALAERLMAAGREAGEPLWRLPLGPEYRKQLDSRVADLKNAGSDRSAGTITAACYLQEFVGDTPWVHLDIAGTAWDFTEKTYIPKGPSGTGVRTLAALLRNWQPLPATGAPPDNAQQP